MIFKYILCKAQDLFYCGNQAQDRTPRTLSGSKNIQSALLFTHS